MTHALSTGVPPKAVELASEQAKPIAPSRPTSAPPRAAFAAARPKLTSTRGARRAWPSAEREELIRLCRREPVLRMEQETLGNWR